MSNQIFQGIYQNYDSALSACERYNLDLNYPIKIWKRRQLDYMSLAKNHSPRFESISGVLAKNSIQQVVDFGGGSGWLFTHLANLGYKINSRIVVETQETISWFKEYNQEVTWITDSNLNELNPIKNSAILYSNSCIQYIETLRHLKSVLLRPWAYLILEDIPNFNGPDFWTRQQYYNFNIPYHFFNINKLRRYIESLGYRLEASSDYPESYPENWEYKIRGNGLLRVPNSAKTLIFKGV